MEKRGVQMNLTEIQSFLKEIYAKPLGDGKKRHIVFWYDEESDFIDDIDELSLENVNLLKLTKHNGFYTKYYIEKEDLTSHLLIYSTMQKPAPQEDWLYDIFAYSEEFATDRITVIMRDLGVHDDSLKHVFKHYYVFFKNKERIQAFKNLAIQDYTEEKVHLGVLATLTKPKLPDLEDILKVLFKEHIDGSSKRYEDIKKFADEEILWTLIRKYYGYSFEEYNIERLMAMLLITSMNEQIKIELPKQYQSYISKQSTNCVVFINHFMNHVKESTYYDKISAFISSKLKIDGLLEQYEMEDFLHCDIFEAIDSHILTNITRLTEAGMSEFERYLALLNSRRTLHFYSHHKSEYKLLKWAIHLLNQKKLLQHDIKAQSSYAMVMTYTKEYMYIDKAYRKFYLHYDRTEQRDNYKSLRVCIENTYNNWYLQELSMKWFAALNDQTNDWVIDGIKQQDKFYSDIVGYSNKERIFVIISDALRFDCGEELATLLTNERKGKVALEVRQSVIPSYTKLGMAALLPHKNLEIDENYHILVDGMTSSGLEGRQAILQKTNNKSMALKYETFQDMNREDIRKAFAGLDVVYIYHNVIDAVGDHALTEVNTFEACETAFKQLVGVVNTLANAVSAANIVITADHGFLYKRDALEEFDKITATKVDDDEDSRRFILTNTPENISGTVSISMDYLLGANCNRYTVTPKGAARFKLQGAGSNYVHGGAMPQEVLIPVIKFKNDRSTSSANEIRTSKITLTSVTRKITNIITYLEFFQSEAIKDKVIGQRVKAYFEDENGERMSNEVTIIGDSRSENPVERAYREKFVLKSITYDKTKAYYLVIKDIENPRAMGERIPFTIDILIQDEFGF